MNNSQLIEDVLSEEKPVDIKPLLREKMIILTEVVEALSALSQSSHWQVLKQYEFDGDLLTLTSRLEKEKDTNEIFRLQGEIKRVKKYNLTALLQERRQELERIKDKLHEPNYRE